MPFDRAALQAADRLWLPKFILRSLTALFAIIAVGTFAAVIAQANYDFGYASFSGIFLVFTFIPLGIGLIWYIISTIYLFLKLRPIHPGWHVGIDLLLSAGYCLFAVTVGFGAIDDYYTLQNYFSDPEDYGYYDQPTSEQLASIGTLVRVQLTGWVMIVLLFLLHFTLFIWACIDTEHRRRRNMARGMADEMIAVMRERGELPPAQQPLLTPAAASPLPYRPYRDTLSPSATPHVQHDQHMSGGLAPAPSGSELSAQST